MQNILMSIRGGHSHPAPEYWLKPQIECPDLGATLELADSCRPLDLVLGKPDLPPFCDDDDSRLADNAASGLRSRGRHGDPEYRSRLEFELSVIRDMGYSGYFLIVEDFVSWSRANGVAVGPGRGSGAGSLVAWCLGITDLDPIVNGLFFERFLNPERVSMPDFDIDFSQGRRRDVIDYVSGRWGADRTGQIATYMSLHPKSAIKDVARVMGIPFQEINDLTSEIPTTIKPKTLEEESMSEFDLALSYAPELANSPAFVELLDISRKLTGCLRQTGKHAGGVVIGRLPLRNYTPTTDDGRTQYDKDDVEDAGLVKFDFLGVKTLDVIEQASKEVGVDIRTIPIDDDDVYKMIAGGDTWGLFQVESRGMTEMCLDMQPTRFEDITAAVALYRPGPMESGMLESYISRKRGIEPVVYSHPALEEVLEETYGTIVYQEQVMQCARLLAGYTLGGADILRRAMGKKKPQEMEKQRQIWLDGCKKNGIDEKLSLDIFESIAKFAGYGFNKSHAAAYALITYQTAWLKFHHRLEFIAALFTIESRNIEKLADYVRSARNDGVVVLGPDVNESEIRFTVVGVEIRWGLGAVKGLGDACLQGIVDGQPYRDVYDLAARSGATKSVVKVLIESGACDRWHGNRSDMIASLDSAFKSKKRTDRRGQMSIIGVDMPETVYPDTGMENGAKRIEREHELLGVYVSGHPATGIDVTTPGTYDGGMEVTGLVVDVHERRTRKGQMMATVVIEDAEGRSMPIVIFPRTWSSVSVERGMVVTFFGGVGTGGGDFCANDCEEYGYD